MGLPVGYLSLLVRGIEGRTGLVLFLGLFGLHLMALVVGHDYQPRSLGRSSTDPR